MRRRDFVLGMCAGGLATFSAPLVSFARVPGRGRLVFVLLRGGFDGLAAVVPYGDPGYRSLRGAMAYDPSDLVQRGDDFGLTPGFAPLADLWQALLQIQRVFMIFRARFIGKVSPNSVSCSNTPRCPTWARHAGITESRATVW